MSCYSKPKIYAIIVVSFRIEFPVQGASITYFYADKPDLLLSDLESERVSHYAHVGWVSLFRRGVNQCWFGIVLV